MADLVKSSKPGDDKGPAARIGAVIKGKWTIDGLLGVGGMAAVYAASHRNGQRAALKILHADFAREKVIGERFLREAYVSNKVNHSATVQVLDDDTTDLGEPFLVMELLLGETVRDAWKKSGRTMPLGRVLQICERILDCLASCHAINVIHRDLKPANIFITDEGEIKVLDFGVAQLRDATSERTATGTALGTPAYMSPEQAMGLVDQLDGRADLFSVGAMMHALSTGHRINNGRTEQEALVMAATKPVPSVARIAPHLPIELIKVIDKAVAWDRRNRFQDAREMQRALIELMPSQSVGALEARPPPRPLEVVANLEAAPTPPPAPVPAGLDPVNASPPLGTSGPVARPPAVPRLGRPSTDAIRAMIPQILVQTQGLSVPVPAQVPQPAYDPLVGYSMPSPGSLAPPQPSQAPGQSGIPEVPESDPRVQAVRDLMKHFDRVLPSVRQFGWAHPATERTLRTALDAIAEALRQQPALLRFTLRPYSFMTLGHTVWEPGAPFDSIPYNLFACGMRTFGIEAGISIDELRDLIALFLVEPGRDLPPEDDLAAAFWEKAMPHVKYQVVDAFAEGDAAEREAFYGEADEVEGLASRAARNQMDRIEAKAMSLSTFGPAPVQSRERSPFALDEPMRASLRPEFDIRREGWSERYVDALVEGYLDSAANRDSPLILASLRKSASDLAVLGRISVAVQLSKALNERLSQRVQGEDNQRKLVAALTNAMFGGETLQLVLRHLRDDPGPLEAFASILSALSGNEVPTVISNLRETTDPKLRQALGSFLERYLAGREAEVAAAVAGSDPEAIATFLQVLNRAGTAAARLALEQLAASEDADVRIGARVFTASSAGQALQEFVALLDTAPALVRIAVLRTITRYQMHNAWPTVARLLNGKTFNELGNDERRETLRAAILLSPERGEALVLELAKKGGVLVTENREATRSLAAELLGDLSRTRQTGTALHELSQSRWGLSEETRLAAANAAKRIAQRLAIPPPGAAIS